MLAGMMAATASLLSLGLSEIVYSALFSDVGEQPAPVQGRG
jgi:hypothetical protein